MEQEDHKCVLGIGNSPRHSLILVILMVNVMLSLKPYGSEAVTTTVYEDLVS